jgi:hypothetical protein
MHGWAKHCNSYILINKHLLSTNKLKKTIALCCEELHTKNPILALEYYPLKQKKKSNAFNDAKDI